MALTDRLRPWAPPVAWCGLILVATSVPLPAEDLPGTDLPLDKVGHAVLYAGLGWTVGRALVRSGWAGAGARVAAWVGGLAFAAADEWHQTFVVTRVPSAGDWAADAVGLTLGLVAVAAYVRRKPGTADGGGRKRSTRTGSADAGGGGGTDDGDREEAGRRTSTTSDTRREGSRQR